MIPQDLFLRQSVTEHFDSFFDLENLLPLPQFCILINKLTNSSIYSNVQRTSQIQQLVGPS